MDVGWGVLAREGVDQCVVQHGQGLRLPEHAEHAAISFALRLNVLTADTAPATAPSVATTAGTNGCGGAYECGWHRYALQWCSVRCRVARQQSWPLALTQRHRRLIASPGSCHGTVQSELTRALTQQPWSHNTHTGGGAVSVSRALKIYNLNIHFVI